MYLKMIQEFLILIFFIKIFVDLTKGKCKSRKRLDNLTVIITGANRGIGLETTRDLARRGARIIMACRRIDAAEKARKEIVDETANNSIFAKELELSSSESIRRFCEDVNKNEEKIDILIHNTDANLYGPFLLTHLLLDLIKRSSDGRIIFVSSLLGLLGNVDFKKLDSNGDFDEIPNSQYSNISKYGFIVLAREFSARLKEYNIAVNSLHPGFIITPIMNQVPILQNIWQILRFIMKTAEEAAQTTIHVAVDDAGRINSGKFFIDCRPFDVFTGLTHLTNRRLLWQKCKQIMDMQHTDSKM